MSVYLAEGISPAAVEAFINKCSENQLDIRTFQIIKSGKPLVRVALEPYELDQPCYIYSLSKSFTSIACGMCIDDGLLSVDTKMCELFADKMPAELTDEHRSMTLGDLLSLQSGHGACALAPMRVSEDSIKTFFEQRFYSKPGTEFCYDTGATCVCAAAAERVTGKKLVDFLDERLFSKLDIEKPRWDECNDGQTFGGTGLYLSSGDIVKFGTLLMNKGVYNGQRIVSEEYVSQATGRRSLEHPDESVTAWTSGYGYQFWLNARGGYRADGAFGQFCFVFPEDDIIAVLTGAAPNTLIEMDYLFELIDNMYGTDGDIASAESLAKSVYKPVRVPEGFNDDISFVVEENGSDIKQIRLFGEALLHIEMQTEYGKKEIVCGNGTYILNHVMLKNLCAGLGPLDERRDTVERLSLFATYEKIEEEKLKVTLHHKDKPHSQCWIIDLNEGRIDIQLNVGVIPTTFLKLSPLESAE